MAFDARDVLYQAQVTLNDAAAVRWPLPELLSYLNVGVREIVRLKPNATADTVELALQTGPYQVLLPGHYLMMRAIRNLTSVAAANPRVGGAAITPTNRDILDATIPGWQQPTVLPYAKTVAHVVQDMADPRVYYVCPGNDGTGLIEAIVSVMPPRIAQPETPLSLAAYSGLNVGLPDEYEATLVDYVLYRAFSKDMSLPGNAQRAVTHMQLFGAALGASSQVEAIANLTSSPQS